MFKKNDSYKNFKVINVFDVKDFHSTAVHLIHKKTGLEVVHFVNDDEENLFSFAFRTPNWKSNGAAHILEHSVLCGSERFPLKDPFVALSNQSVNTYLNAMTYPDRTVFPASSVIRADYFNLMNVYGDAVFFPKLEPEIFLQEAHRLEIDEKGNPSIQGVVYNEMKGDYSSFESSVSTACNVSLLKGSVYEKDSGGDPLDIPSITHDELKDFHKKWYRPDNCLVFLYGNISTEEQLDFLQENILNRLEKKYPEIDYSELSLDEYENKKSESICEFLKYVTPTKIETPVELRCEGPGDSEKSNTVIVNWSFGTVEDADSAAINTFITGILLNHDGSPLQKALVDSHIGEDIAPQTGFSSYIHDAIFSLGLRGVKAGDEKKVEKVIFDTLNKLVKDGISKNDIEATMMTLEFSQRSIKRIDGPYSKILMGRIIYGWLYGYDISKQIRQRSSLEKIKTKIDNDSKFFEKKIKEYFLENKNRSLVVVTPSKAFSEKRDEAEKKLIQDLMLKTTVESIKASCEKLHDFQKQPSDNSCLPHLKPKDFIIDGKPMLERIKIDISEIEGVDFKETGRKIPLFKNTEKTNGIVYFQIGFPIDVLDASDYPYIPTYTDVCVDVGWNCRKNGKFLDWAESSEVCALHTGGLGCSHLIADAPIVKESKELREKYDWIGREWLIFRLSMLEEEIENALEIFADSLTGVDFHDFDRLKDVIIESRNDFESSIVPNGHSYVDMRIRNGQNRASTIEEMWNGLSQLYTLRKIADNLSKNDKSVVDIYKRIHTETKNGGSFIQIIAEESGIKKISSLLPKFIDEVQLKSLKSSKNNELSNFKKMNVLPIHINEAISEENKNSDFADFEILVANTQVGFAAEVIEATPYGFENETYQDICSHWFSNNLLWERIRTVGGAYGAYSSMESISGMMTFVTYRDPNPFKSCDVFDECLKEAMKIDFDEETIEKTIVGNYSHWLQPKTPRSRGVTSLVRTLSGISEINRENKVNWLLNTDSEKMKNAFKDLYEKSLNSERIKKRKAVLCDESTLQELLESEKQKNIDYNMNRRIVYLPV